MSVLLLVVLLHAALFLAFKQSSGSHVQGKLVELIETELVEVIPPKLPEPPLLLPVSFEKTLAFAPPPDVAMRTPMLQFDDSAQTPERISTTAVVKFCVQEDGRLDASSVSIANSTGVPKLDEAAISIAKHWTLPPRMENGKPVKVCGVTAPIQFRLPEQPTS